MALARAGSDLVLVDIGADLPGVGYPMGTAGQLEATAAACHQQGAATEVVVGELRSARTCENAAQRARDRFRRIDTLVNCAGLAGPSGKPVHEVSHDDWALVLGINLTAAWQLIREVAPTMVEQRSGSVINIASTAGVVGYRHFAGYVASKHGLVGLTKAAALDLAPFGVRVNALSPSSIRNDLELDGRMLSAIADNSPATTWSRPRTWPRRSCGWPRRLSKYHRRDHRGRRRILGPLTRKTLTRRDVDGLSQPRYHSLVRGCRARRVSRTACSRPCTASRSPDSPGSGRCPATTTSADRGRPGCARPSAGDPAARDRAPATAGSGRSAALRAAGARRWG